MGNLSGRERRSWCGKKGGATEVKSMSWGVEKILELESYEGHNRHLLTNRTLAEVWRKNGAPGRM